MNFSYPVIFVGYIFLHVAGGAFGNYLSALSQSTVFFWPPVGLSLALLLIYGYRYWPAIFVAGIVQAVLAGASSPSILLFAGGSTLGPLITTYILRRYINFNYKMEKLRDVIGLIFIALPISATILSTIVTTARVINNTVLPANFPIVWMNIWVSDLLSNIIVATPLVLWFCHDLPKKFPLKRVLESIGLAGVVLGVCLIIFSKGLEGAGPKTYLVFFPVIWAALRYGPRETMTIVFIFCSLAVKTTAEKYGPFIVNGPTENLLYLRAFMLIYAISSLMLAAAVFERRQFEKRKNSFIEIASHELKTPLTSLKILTQMLKKDAEKEKKHVEQFNVMEEQINKLTGLTSSLLDLSRIQAEKFTLKKEFVSLQKIIDSAITTVQYTEKSHKIIVPSNVRVKIFADKERIGQVLINLITNAIKHSPYAKKVIVDVVTQGDFVQISVQDFGVGISKEKLGMIFERFYQISEGKELEGLGLGLFISSEIIKQHNGKIWVTSDEGKGATFFFTLPIRNKL